MDTIVNYVENMFKTLPKTEELKKLKSEILSNMEDKYQELKEDGKTENEAIGIVISEFGNIDEIIKEFGVEINNSKSEESLPTIYIDRVKEYLNVKKQTSFLVSIGVALCMLGAAILIMLQQMAEDRIILTGVALDTKDIVPVIILLIFVGIAVGLFIYSGITLEKFKDIEKGEFAISSSTRIFIEEDAKSIKHYKTVGIITGVILCILSPIAIFIGGMFSESGYVYGTSTLLLIVAIAVVLFINLGGNDDGHKKLLKEGEYSIESRKSDKVIGAVASIVWPIAVIIFLTWSFLFGSWEISWIVFPITGVLFGGFCSVYKSIKGIEE